MKKQINFLSNYIFALKWVKYEILYRLRCDFLNYFCEKVGRQLFLNLS